MKKVFHLLEIKMSDRDMAIYEYYSFQREPKKISLNALCDAIITKKQWRDHEFHGGNLFFVKPF